MGLAQQREPAAVEPLDEPQLPQRAVAIKRLGEDPAGQPLEVALGTGARQRRVAHVIGQVEVRVVDPDGTALVEGHERQPLSVAWNQMQPQADLVDELGVRGGFALEHHAAGHVHVRGVTLEMQE